MVEYRAAHKHLQFSTPDYFDGALLHDPWRVPTSMATAHLSSQFDSFSSDDVRI
jgi:hypothetical protein